MTNAAFDQVAAGEVDLAGLEEPGLAAEEVHQKLLRLPGMYGIGLIRVGMSVQYRYDMPGLEYAHSGCKVHAMHSW